MATKTVSKGIKKHTEVMYTYKYKGKSILQKHVWSVTRQKWNQEFFVIEKGPPYGHYRTLTTAKKAIDKVKV
jgi:hypothetical protein